MNFASLFSFSDKDSVLRKTGRLFPQMWWRMALYFLFTLVTILFLTLLMGAIVFFALGDIFSPNSFSFTDLSFFTSNPIFFLFLAVAYLTALLVPLSLFKISLLLSLKNLLGEKKDDTFENYFKHSWGFFWKYILLFALIGLYVLLPLLIASFLAFLLSWVTLSFFDLVAYIGFIAPFSLIIVLLGVLWTIPRLLSVFFSSAALIHFEKPPREALAFSQAILRGKRFFLFLLLCFLALLTFFLLLPLTIGDYMMNFGTNISWQHLQSFISYTSSSYEPSIFASLKFLVSLFIFAPLGATFSYLLMLRFAKEHTPSDS